MHPQNKTEYKKLLNDILDKQALIFGSTITLLRLKHVKGLTLDEHGQIGDFSDSIPTVVESLIEVFQELSPSVSKYAMAELFPIVESFSKLPKDQINPNQTTPLDEQKISSPLSH